MTLVPLGSVKRVIALFSNEEPHLTPFMRKEKVDSGVPIIGGYWMVIARTRRRFYIHQICALNPTIDFKRLHGYRPNLPEAVRNTVPTMGNNCVTPVYHQLRWKHIAQAMIAPDEKPSMFTHDGQTYKVVMKNGLPHRWHYREIVDPTGKSTVPTYYTGTEVHPYPLYLTWLREIYAESPFAAPFHRYLRAQ